MYGSPLEVAGIAHYNSAQLWAPKFLPPIFTMAHPFFLSYARNDNWQRTDPHMATFVDELNKRVRYYTGARDNGFRDVEDIKAGQEWRDELIDALAGAPTIVCLYSRAYFLSDACGKELQVFLERRRKYIKDNSGRKPASIIPVYWLPSPKIARAIPDFQFDEPPRLDLKNEGVWNLADSGKTDEFRRIINNVALRIRDAIDDTPLPQLGWRPTFDGVQSAFTPALPLKEFDAADAAAGPECVTFVYASDPEWRSWPYAPPEDQALLHISASIATGHDYLLNQLTYDAVRPDLVARLQKAREQNNLVVTLVDGRSLANPLMQQRLREYDDQRFETFSTMLVWPPAVKADLPTVRNTFPFFCSRPQPFFYGDITKPEELNKAVSETLGRLKNLVSQRPVNPNPLPSSSQFNSLPTNNRPSPSGD